VDAGNSRKLLAISKLEKGVRMATLENKVALVTGATSGIGKAAALALGTAGKGSFQADASKKEKQPPR
jgi:hypothetical protein